MWRCEQQVYKILENSKKKENESVGSEHLDGLEYFFVN